MTFDLARVLAVLNNNNVNLGLKKAMFIAQVLVDLHSERIVQVENAAYERGIAVGRENQLSTEDHYELSRLRNMEQHMKTMAKNLVGEIVDTYGRDRKITCIKELRSRTGLGLKESKDIVEDYMSMTAPF
jgi:ribosomal protein L7/L12